MSEVDPKKMIAREQRQIAVRTQKKLATGDLDGAERDIRRLQYLDAILAVLLRDRAKKIPFAVVVGLLCLLVVSLAWFFHMPSTRLHGTITSDAVMLETEREWRWQGGWRLSPPPLRISEPTSVEAPMEFQLPGLSGDRLSLEIKGDDKTITYLGLGMNADVAITQSSSFYLISARAAPFSIEIQANGQTSASLGSATTKPQTRDYTFEVPGTFFAEGDGLSAVPMQVRLQSSDFVAFTDIPIRRLSFSREYADYDGETRFRSSIKEGKLTISDTNRVLNLTAR